MIKSDKFSHLYKDVLNGKEYIGELTKEDCFSEPCDIVFNKDFVIVFFSWFSKFSATNKIIGQGYSYEYNGIRIPRFGDIINGLVLPENGISKIQISTLYGNFKYNLIWENKISRFHTYDNTFKRTELLSIKWVKFSSGPINYLNQWNDLYIKVYDTNGKIYDKLEIIYSFVESKFIRKITGGCTNFLHYYEKERVVMAQKYNHDSDITEKRIINLKLINRLCRNRYNIKRKILKKYLYRDLIKIVFSY